MTNDNYKATSSALIDAPETTRARPRNVNIALGLIGGGVLIRLIMTLKFFQESQFEIATPWVLAVPIGGLVLLGVICHQIAHGKGWARLLLLLLTLFVFAQLCWGIGYIWRQAPEMLDVSVNTHYVLTRVVPLALNMAALHLLYFSSGDWFGAREARSHGS